MMEIHSEEMPTEDTKSKLLVVGATMGTMITMMQIRATIITGGLTRIKIKHTRQNKSIPDGVKQDTENSGEQRSVDKL